MDPITIATLLMSIGGSVYGGIKNSQQNTKNDKYLQSLIGKNQAEYNKDYNTNYLDTEEAKSAIRSFLEQIKKTNQNIESSGAITGASAEKAVAQKGKGLEALGGLMNNLTGRGTARKDMIKDRFQNREMRLDNMLYNNMLQKSQNWSQFQQNAMNLGMTGLLANQGGDLTGLGQRGKLSEEQMNALPGILGIGFNQNQTPGTETFFPRKKKSYAPFPF